VLVADRDIEAAVSGLLRRTRAIPLRPVTYEVFVHAERDPGCRKRAHEFLRSQSSASRHALVVFDRDGCGHPGSAEEIEQEVEGRLRDSGWDDRARAVVIDPELEVWVWSDSPNVDRALGFAQQLQRPRDWLAGRDLWPPGADKPPDPKRAVQAVLHQARKPRSASIYEELAAKVSIDKCTDRAFVRLLRVLRAWFPPPS
jgi:hypothetical protein